MVSQKYNKVLNVCKYASYYYFIANECETKKMWFITVVQINYRLCLNNVTHVSCNADNRHVKGQHIFIYNCVEPWCEVIHPGEMNTLGINLKNAKTHLRRMAYQGCNRYISKWIYLDIS